MSHTKLLGAEEGFDPRRESSHPPHNRVHQWKLRNYYELFFILARTRLAILAVGIETTLKDFTVPDLNVLISCPYQWISGTVTGYNHFSSASFWSYISVFVQAFCISKRFEVKMYQKFVFHTIPLQRYLAGIYEPLTARYKISRLYSTEITEFSYEQMCLTASYVITYILVYCRRVHSGTTELSQSENCLFAPIILHEHTNRA
jgi:hypothetical protein